MVDPMGLQTLAWRGPRAAILLETFGVQRLEYIYSMHAIISNYCLIHARNDFTYLPP